MTEQIHDVIIIIIIIIGGGVDCRVWVRGCGKGAAAESFFATIKAEPGIERRPDRATARRDIENWINTCNEWRLHSSPGSQAPVETRIARRQRISTAA